MGHAKDVLLTDGRTIRVWLDFTRRERAAVRKAYDQYLFERLNAQKEGEL